VSLLKQSLTFDDVCLIVSFLDLTTLSRSLRSLNSFSIFLIFLDVDFSSFLVDSSGISRSGTSGEKGASSRVVFSGTSPSTVSKSSYEFV